MLVVIIIISSIVTKYKMSIHILRFIFVLSRYDFHFLSCTTMHPAYKAHSPERCFWLNGSQTQIPGFASSHARASKCRDIYTQLRGSSPWSTLIKIKNKPNQSCQFCRFLTSGAFIDRKFFTKLVLELLPKVTFTLTTVIVGRKW